MAQRERVEHRSDRSGPVEESTDAAVQPTAAANTSDIDAILDEIDEVLEENAEEFVRSFVQKGGQ